VKVVVVVQPDMVDMRLEVVPVEGKTGDTADHSQLPEVRAAEVERAFHPADYMELDHTAAVGVVGLEDRKAVVYCADMAARKWAVVHMSTDHAVVVYHKGTPVQGAEHTEGHMAAAALVPADVDTADIEVVDILAVDGLHKDIAGSLVDRNIAPVEDHTAAGEDHSG
jgi:hypothetical protein